MKYLPLFIKTIKTMKTIQLTIFSLTIIFCLCTCQDVEKCSSPNCGDVNTITYRIGEQAPNQSNYNIDCGSDQFFVCFCARIPQNLVGEVWNAVVLQGTTPIASISSDNVSLSWKDKILVNTGTYGNVRDDFRIQIFVGANNSGMNYSNYFTWSCD